MLNEKVSVEMANLPIIGYHQSALSQKFGIPRQPNLVHVPSSIKMLAPYDTPDAFLGIEAFSHLWIAWQTHHNKTPLNTKTISCSSDSFKPKVRPPRLGGNTKLGVFATRSTYRPSQMGLSVVALKGIEIIDNSVVVHISGADMVDGTPILDIKPYIGYSDSIANAISGFAPQRPISKQVKLSELAKTQLVNNHYQAMVEEGVEKQDSKLILNELDASKDSQMFDDASRLSQDDMAIICQLIAQDPRPAYRQNDTHRVFVMRYKCYDISFKMNVDKSMEIVSINRVG